MLSLPILQGAPPSRQTIVYIFCIRNGPNDSTQVILVHSTSGDPQVACHLSQNVCHDSVKAIMKHMVDTISVLYPGWHFRSSMLNNRVHVVIVREELCGPIQFRIVGTDYRVSMPATQTEDRRPMEMSWLATSSPWSRQPSQFEAQK